MQSRFTFELDGETIPVAGEPVSWSLGDFLATRGFSGAPLLTRDAGGQLRSVETARMALPAAAGRVFWSAAGLPDSHPAVAAMRSRPEIATDRRARDWATVSLVEAWHREDFDGGDVSPLDGWPSRQADFGAIRDLARQLSQLPDRQLPLAASVPHSTPDKDDFAYVDAGKRRFHRPRTRAEVSKLIAQFPDGSCTVALDGVDELRSVLDRGDRWEIGAAATLTEVAESAGKAFPVLKKALHGLGSLAERNVVPLGSRLEDLAPALMALEASVRAASAGGEREIPINRFFEGGGRTSLRPAEWVAALSIPAEPEERVSDLLVAGPVRAGFAIDFGRDGQVKKIVLAYAGIADRPLRARETERDLRGREWSEQAMLGALGGLSAELDGCLAAEGLSDREIEYRRQLTATLLQKFFLDHFVLEES